MANTDQVYGFLPVEHIDGSPWNGQTRKCYKAAGTTSTDDLFIGDLVVLSGSADSDGYCPSVVAATAGATNDILGAIVSIDPDPDNLSRTWIDGASTGYVNVCCDPSVVYEAQSNGSLAATDIGNNANMVQTTDGDRTRGSSGQEVNSSVAGTANYQLKILGIARRPDNALGADVKVLVVINDHQLGNQTSGV